MSVRGNEGELVNQIAASGDDRCVRLAVPVGNAAFGEIVGRHFEFYFVSGENANVKLPHFPGDMRQNDVVVLELYAKHRVGEHLGDDPFGLDRVFRHWRVSFRLRSGVAAYPQALLGIA